VVSDDTESESRARAAGQFATTHWSVVLAAGDAHSPRSAQALETLCRTYWYPLYAYVRRRGHSPEEAEDLIQEFLVHLLATHALGTVHPAKGRFRSFLLASLNHFLANEWDKARAQKRGGGQMAISLDTAEARYRAEPGDDMSPERIFERHWAMALLAQVSVRLRENYQTAGNGPLFETLRIYLTGEKGLPSYQQTADQLGLSLEAVKKAVERLRRRYGELLREEIAHTVNDPAEVDEEIRHLRIVLSRP